MSQANPYEKFLDGRSVESILAATPAALTSAFAAFGERADTPPAPGKWSPAKIACHLADCELVFAFRLRQIMAEDAPTLQPFDQERWATQYNGVPAAQALAVFSALRQWNLRLIGSALPSAAARPATHPERGALTFASIVETMAGHDLNHLGQLQKIAAAP